MTVQRQSEVQKLTRAVEELATLNHVASAISEAASLTAAVEVLVDGARKAANSEEGVIVLLAPPVDGQDDDPFTLVRSVATSARRANIHPSQSVLGWIQLHSRPLIVNDPAGDERFKGEVWPDDIRNVLAVPLLAGGRLTGVFTLFNKRQPEGGEGFTEADARLLSILASQSAQAVERMRMAEDQERALRLFGQHTAPQVVEALMAHVGELPVRRQDVTVMFLDLRGFTLRSESWPPEEVVAYLNTLFDLAISTIVGHGGVVHQLLGDGLMALFGFPTPEADAPARAVASALDIVNAVEAACASGELAETRLGIGVHAGEAVVGPVGSAEHQEFKVTGDVVNVTARIEKLCKVFDARVLVSEAVYERLDDDQRAGEPLGSVPLDGRKEPVSVVRLA
ncbi:MAG: hypothetical protein Rubg2KO_06920 [Rubricoccaceae bacterium]